MSPHIVDLNPNGIALLRILLEDRLSTRITFHEDREQTHNIPNFLRGHVVPFRLNGCNSFLLLRSAACAILNLVVDVFVTWAHVRIMTWATTRQPVVTRHGQAASKLASFVLAHHTIGASNYSLLPRCCIILEMLLLLRFRQIAPLHSASFRSSLLGRGRSLLGLAGWGLGSDCVDFGLHLMNLADSCPLRSLLLKFGRQLNKRTMLHYRR